MSSVSKSVCGILAATIIVSLVIALSGCGGGGGGAPLADVSGVVKDDGTLAGLSGATVTLGQSVQTTAGGVFALTGVASGSQTITVSNTGYDTKLTPVTLAGGSNTIPAIYLAPTLQSFKGNVSGLVLEGSTPVAGASVQCAGVQATSKSDGSFALYNVTSGDQTVWATSGAKTGSRLVHISTGTTVSGQNITISSGPPPPPF